MSTKISELTTITSVDVADVIPINDVSAGDTKKATVAQILSMANAGVGTQAMADANQTPISAVYQNGAIKTTGALTANRNLTLPSVSSDSDAYQITINNTCTGSFSVVVTTGAGTTVNIANGMTAIVLIDSRGVTRVTADV